MLATPAPPTSPQFTAFVSAPSPPIPQQHSPHHAQLIQISGNTALHFPGSSAHYPGSTFHIPGHGAAIMAAVTAATASAATTPEPAMTPAPPVPAPAAAAVPAASSARDLPGNSGGGGVEECRIGIRRVTKYDFKSVVELFRVREVESFVLPDLCNLVTFNETGDT